MVRQSLGIAALAIAATIIGLLGAPPFAVAGTPLPDARVVVRVYDGGREMESSWPGALPAAAVILAETGIEVQWLRCDAHDEPVACAMPAGTGEFAMRMVEQSARDARAWRLPLGYALIDSRTRSGTLATIFVDRVLWLARTASVDAGTLLGRAMAHEIGHLLLGGNRHSRAGLMRAVWAREEIRRGLADDWRFTNHEGAAMRATLRSRAPALVALNSALEMP